MILIGCALFAAICLLVLVYSMSISCVDAPGVGSCTRILFIGNSYTSVNNLPAMFVKLSRAGGHKVEVGVAAPGGWTLSQHANSSETLEKIKSSKWDFVVLQEQSQIPSIEQSRTVSMYPAARLLVHQIEEAGAAPLLFLTWAHRNGWSENSLQGDEMLAKACESMQFQIDRGYLEIARELNVGVAPVGYAWLVARRQNPQLELWQDDGSHPSAQGTYLAACVFYAAIFRQSPEGLTYRAYLPNETAAILQAVAATIVLKNPKQWYLP